MRHNSRPIERISNLLAEIAELRTWIRLALTDYPHVHPVPPPVASTWEHAIRSARSRSNHSYEETMEENRLSQRRSRIRLDDGYRVRASSTSGINEAAILAEIDMNEDYSQPPRRNAPAHDPLYDPPPQNADNFLNFNEPLLTEEEPVEEEPVEEEPSPSPLTNPIDKPPET